MTSNDVSHPLVPPNQLDSPRGVFVNHQLMSFSMETILSKQWHEFYVTQRANYTQIQSFISQFPSASDLQSLPDIAYQVPAELEELPRTYKLVIRYINCEVSSY
jgi:hypothetical protein